jgi:hypothetical protein
MLPLRNQHGYWFHHQMHSAVILVPLRHLLWPIKLVNSFGLAQLRETNIQMYQNSITEHKSFYAPTMYIRYTIVTSTVQPERMLSLA